MRVTMPTVLPNCLKTLPARGIAQTLRMPPKTADRLMWHRNPTSLAGMARPLVAILRGSKSCLSGVQRRTFLRGSAPAATLYINGESSGASDGVEIEVVSPANESVIGRLSDASAEDASRAVSSARQAFESNGRSWSKAHQERSRALVETTMWLRDNAEQLAQLESLDCGKPIVESRVDVAFCADVFDYYAKLASSQEHVVGQTGQCEARAVSEARGVCALVTPWNFPLMQAVLKLAPALAAGNTVVLKPSPLASLSCLRLMREALGPLCPPGVVNLLTGGPPASSIERGSKSLVAHPKVDFTSFTGSSRGGREVLSVSASQLRPASVELGGKGALVVLEDADLDIAADWAIVGIFQCAGQVCSATSRLLAHRDIYHTLLDKILERTSKLVQGNPLDEATTFGPVVSRQRAEAILAAVNRAPNPPVLVHGLTKFSYVAAHVFADVPVDCELWQEEIFGPVLAARPFNTQDEAINLVNDSLYGLAHAVISSNADRANQVARSLDAGVVWTNTNQLLWPEVPFGGLAGKKSGFGWEGGVAGLHEFQRSKTIVSAPPGFAAAQPP